MQKSTPKSPKIFAAIQFEPALRCILTPVVIGNMNPNFDFKSVIPLQITADLDRHLRTSKMVIVFADDEKTDHIYGFCKIGLSKMIYEQSLNESVDICNKNGDVTGKLNIMLSWDVPYIQHNPTVISIHDQSEISLELSGVVNDLPTISTQPMISEAEPIHPTLNKEEPSLLMPQQQIVEAKPISDVSSNNESDSDPINVNINHTDSKLESKPHAEEEIFSSSLGIQMNSLTIHLNDQRVQSTFSNTQQIFVCVELLNLSGPDFESNSIVINGGKSFDVGYNKGLCFH
ncbi:hypothetical protein BC833DRAFT_47057 [Globomyces pollinis-pini]|nr:hypothetical protein BC833DRAFT_47057 [Globomyces pollinis-pini]